MKKTTLFLGILLLSIGASVAAAEVTAEDAFTTLKEMAGSWYGTPEGVDEEAATEAEADGQLMNRIQVSAAGTVVMETMGPGTEHEMINMYHLDGDDLVVTHYCAGGNQPTMRLNRETSNAERLVFDFTGGTNLDPATDHYIHDIEIGIRGGDEIETVWNSWSDGEQSAQMTFYLTRGE